MTIPTRPDFRGGGIGEAIAANQRLEHVMTLLEHIAATLQRIEDQGKSKTGNALNKYLAASEKLRQLREKAPG